MILETIPFYIASATLPYPLLCDVSEILHLRKGRTEYIFRSNDHPNIALAVCRMQHPANTYEDLAFIILSSFKAGDPPPPKFLSFCNSIKEAEAATLYLRKRLPPELAHKIKWFHSNMTADYRADEFEALQDGYTYGLVVTDTFGMVKIIITEAIMRS